MYLFLGLFGSICGLIIAIYIRKQKKKKKKLVCPRQGSCDKVVHSMYSKTLGIPNELMGIAFYFIIAILYFFIIIYPPFMNSFVSWTITVMTISGIMFSLYLIALQAFVIKEWCMWCLGSACATAILVIALFGLDRNNNFVVMIATQKIGWIFLHILGLVLGAGGSTVGDIMFLRFLKDGKISLTEKKFMDKITSIVWVGIALLVLSGTMLYLPHSTSLNHSSVFVLKMIITACLIVIGVLLNMLIAPKMRRFSFANTRPARSYRRLSFALGALSIVSWYTVLVISLFTQINLALRESAALYVAIMITTVIATNTYESIISQRKFD